MPTYEYDCRNCGLTIEIMQSMKDEPLRDCPECDQPTLKRRIGTGAGIIFKGSGFYETDYKRPAQPKAGGNGEGTPSSGAEAKPEATAKPAADSKPSTTATSSSTAKE